MDARRFAPKFAALGHEARLAIMRLLLAAHPDGLVVGEIQQELDIPPSTLSHHLDALQREALVHVTREGKFLRYRADAAGLRALLSFLYAEC
ncbi:MAG: ArsR/SmtB family transcription factor, partial [Gemmatimonadales bacterium]